MGLYYIGKTQNSLKNIENLSGSHTIFGESYDNHFACYSKNDENKSLSSNKIELAHHDLRYGMETFKFLDKDAKFIFDDKQLCNELMKIKNKEFIVKQKDIEIIE